MLAVIMILGFLMFTVLPILFGAVVYMIGYIKEMLNEAFKC